MRVFNRLAALLLGLVLIAGGALVVADGVLTATGRRPWLIRFDSWYGPLTRARLNQPLVLAVAIAVGVLGLLLLFAELRPWAPRHLAVRGGDGEVPVDWWVYRRSVERQLVGAVQGVTGVSHAKARLRGRRDRWRLVVTAAGRSDSRPAVYRTVQSELARVAAPGAVKLRVAMRKPRRVA